MLFFGNTIEWRVDNTELQLEVLLACAQIGLTFIAFIAGFIAKLKSSITKIAKGGLLDGCQSLQFKKMIV